ncbi:MAG: HD domain-containing protein [Chloroflexi bacterium]|nr:HD domain-containing protein [Chloroflexota bacterium]
MRLVTWPLNHIRWKIVLPYAFLTVVLAVAGSYMATQVVTGSLAERFENQLTEAGRVVADSVVRKEREHLETVRAVAFTAGIPDAVRAGDKAKIEGLVGPIAGNAAVERLEILDSQGGRLKTLWLADEEALLYQELSDADDPATWPLVQKALQGEVDELGDKYAQIVETSEGFVLYTAGPITDNGEVVGAVLVGTSLDSFVTATKAEALADITVYDFAGNPLASTYVRPDDASGDARLDVGGEVLEDATLGVATVREHRTLWGRGYDLVYGRLDVRDQAVGLYSVGLPTEFMFSAAATTRTQIALLFGVAMAAVLGIGLYLAHRLTRPLLRLVRTARLVAAGDLTARSEVVSSDEIGTLASSFDEMTSKLQHQHLATIKALTSAIDARDPHTMGHSVRVGQLAIMIGRHLRLDEKTLAQLEIGGYLHDIGKIGIRDAILLKPGALTPEERLIIEEHPRIGLAILDPVDLAKEVLEFVESHHERLDGSGYPHGLRDDLVSIVARIAAVSDVYDAVTSERPYRGPMTPEEGLALLQSDAGSLFDPRVVEAFAAVQPEWERRRASEPELQGFKLPDFDSQKVTA